MSESCKQTCCSCCSSFKPTTNDRNAKMFAEAKSFRKKLKACRKKIVVLQKASRSTIKTTNAAVTKPLRVYEKSPTATVTQSTALPVPAPPVQVPVAQKGAGVDGVVAKNMAEKLDQDALLPIDAWLKEYDETVKPVKNLEKLRLKFDATRRAYSKWEVKKVKQQNKKDAVDQKVMNNFTMKETALTSARQAYVTQEEQVYALLTKLAADGHGVKTQIASVVSMD